MAEVLTISQNIITIWWAIIICLWVIVMALIISILLKVNSVISDIKQKYFLAVMIFTKPIVLFEKLVKSFKK